MFVLDDTRNNLYGQESKEDDNIGNPNELNDKNFRPYRLLIDLHWNNKEGANDKLLREHSFEPQRTHK